MMPSTRTRALFPITLLSAVVWAATFSVLACSNSSSSGDGGATGGSMGTGGAMSGTGGGRGGDTGAGGSSGGTTGTGGQSGATGTGGKGGATGGSSGGRGGTAGTGAGGAGTGGVGTGGHGGTAGSGGSAGGSAGLGGASGKGGSTGTGGGSGGQGGAHSCGPDPSCTRCTTGACCGSSCCGPGEWCDTSGATPVCRCFSSNACPSGEKCASSLGGANICGAICCMGSGCPVSRRMFKRDIHDLDRGETERILRRTPPDQADDVPIQDRSSGLASATRFHYRRHEDAVSDQCRWDVREPLRLREHGGGCYPDSEPRDRSASRRSRAAAARALEAPTSSCRAGSMKGRQSREARGSQQIARRIGLIASRSVALLASKTVHEGEMPASTSAAPWA